MSTTDIQEWHLFTLYRSSFQQARDHFLLGCFFFSPNTTGRSSHLCGAQCEQRIGKRAVDLFIDLAELQNKIKRSLTKKSSGMWEIPVINDQTSRSCHKLEAWSTFSLSYFLEGFFGFYTTGCWILLASAARIEKPNEPSPSVERCFHSGLPQRHFPAPRAAVSRALHWHLWNSPGRRGRRTKPDIQ